MIEHVVQGSAVSPPVSEQIARASPSSSGCDLSDHETHSERSVPSSSSPAVVEEYAGFESSQNAYFQSSKMQQKSFSGGCNSCRSAEIVPVARCLDCCSNLCDQCEKAHRYMTCFESHRLVPVSSCQNQSDESKHQQQNMARLLACPAHQSLGADFFCRSCNVPICVECMQSMHAQHDYSFLDDEAHRSAQMLNQMSKRARAKLADAASEVGNAEFASKMLPTMYSSAMAKVDEVYERCLSLLNDVKMDVLKELQTAYSRQLSQFGTSVQQAKETIEKFRLSVDKIDQLLSCANPIEVLMNKSALSKHLESVASYTTDVRASECGLRLEISQASSMSAVRSMFGQVVTGSPASVDRAMAPFRQTHSASPLLFGNLMTGQKVSEFSSADYLNARQPSYFDQSSSRGLYSTSSSTYAASKRLDRNGNSSPFGVNTDAASSSSSLFRNSLCSEDSMVDALSTSIAMSVLASDNTTDVTTSQFGGLWSNRMADQFQPLPSATTSHSVYGPIGSVRLPEPISSSTALATTSSSSSQQPKSQVKRMKMMYQCKFGEYGVSEAQFTEPSGVTVNATGDVVVADTNNHRIQVFDVDGHFKYQFGECGKRDGQLLYPNRIAVMKHTNDIVITERSPTHQVQIYTQYGQFVRKFGSNILQHPRGIAVDRKGRIVIVECKVMRVIVFDYMGNVVSKFCCAKYLQFPNGIAVNDNDEIFISDNHAHCVKVFSYTGQYLRQIGGEGITNYPVGVVVNPAGEVIVADNHNNFNLTVFSPDGQLLGAFESKVKHAQCFDIALVENRSVVLATKDYRLYIYKLPTC